MRAAQQRDSLWIRRFAPAPDVPVQLVCFPHAGGSAAYYSRLAAALCPTVDVLAVQYPGRLDRRREPALESVADLAEQVTAALEPWHDRSLALFGHSLGAVVAFEVARRLDRAGRTPIALFASARRAPSLVRPECAHLLDDDALILRVRDLGGTDPRVLADEELLELALPVIRADYRAIETYRHIAGPPLRCPLTVLTGQDDQEVSTEDAWAWREHTAAGFEVITLPGGHFYLDDEVDAVTEIVTTRVRAESARRRIREYIFQRGWTTMTNETSLTFEPEDVGRFYDQLTLTAKEQGTFADNIHVGYWDDTDPDDSLPAAVDRLTELMTARLGLNKDDHVLDVGCGVGGPAVRIARATGARVTGITVSREQAAAATRLAEEAGLADRVQFRVHDAMRLDFANESFDAAIAIESIIHMPDREQVLANVRRVLRPGGRLVLTDIFVRAPRGAETHPAIRKFERNMLVTMADIDDYAAMVHRSGLRLRELLDITENSMQQTFRTLARPVEPGGSPEFLGQESDPHVFDPAELVGVDDFGCLLMVAERP